MLDRTCQANMQLAAVLVVQLPVGCSAGIQLGKCVSQFRRSKTNVDICDSFRLKEPTRIGMSREKVCTLR